MSSERKLTPQERYQKANTISCNLRLCKNTEQDIIEHLGKQPNKCGYLKRLIREDMAKSK